MLHSDRLSQTIAVATQVGPKQFRPITLSHATSLQTALVDDADRLSQIALASLFEGARGVIDRRTTWATVKLYYSAFYAIRARLMLNNVSIFYLGRSPHVLEARAGAITGRRGGNSHTVAIEEFLQRMSTDITLSQDIGGTCSLRWLEEKRNSASYKSAPFVDPVTPVEYRRFTSKPRSHFQAYLGADASLYAFDPEHAMLAYPIYMLSNLSSDLVNFGRTPVRIERHYVNILSSANSYVPEFGDTLKCFQFS